MNNPIGTAWLVHRYALQVAQPLPVLSEIGGRRESRRVDGAQRERYTEAVRQAFDDTKPGADADRD